MEAPKNLSPPVITPSMVADTVANHTGHHSSPPVAIHETGGYSRVANLLFPLFTPLPYILMENMMVVVEDFALNDNGVAFALANSLTLQKTGTFGSCGDP